eukprot:339930_1
MSLAAFPKVMHHQFNGIVIVYVLINYFFVSLISGSQILATTYFDFINPPTEGYSLLNALLSAQYDLNSKMSYSMIHQFAFHFGLNGYLGFQSFRETLGLALGIMIKSLLHLNHIFKHGIIGIKAK